MEFMEKGKAFMFLLVLLDARQVRSHFKSRFPKRLEGRALAGARAAQRGQSPAVIQMNSEFSHTAPFTDRETAAGFSHDKRKCFFFFIGLILNHFHIITIELIPYRNFDT
jgi:hypothetical protein